MDVSNTPVEYTCYGLGSCIGLFVTDRVKGLSGGAHIPLPSALHEGVFLDASQLIEQLLSAFSLNGSDLNTLRAKVTGGAQIYAGTSDIGQQNVSIVLQTLIDKKIFIAAKDVGGLVSRTVRFTSTTGELQISTSEQKTYSI